MFRNLSLILILALTALANAHLAIVVGINNYHYYRGLEGAVPDAQSVNNFLVNKGFKPTLLINETATRENILKALAEVRANIHRHEWFVFYFAGHGHAGSPQELVPYDFKSAGSGIGADDLFKHIKAIKDNCDSATVILDCCFAGAISKGIDAKLRSRCIFLPGEKGGPDVDDPDSQQFIVPDIDKLGPKKPICYFCAAKANQSALEAYYIKERQHHGLFTHTLVPMLKGTPEDWGNTQDQINKDMDKYLASVADGDRRYQQANVTKEYRPVYPFGPQQGPDTVVPKTVCDLLDQVRSDPSRLQLTVAPNQRNFRLGEPIDISIAVKGKGGYLVVMSADNSIYLQWPKQATKGKPVTAEDAKVDAGATVDLSPPGQFSSFVTSGSHVIRAYLFDAKETANAVLSYISKKGSMQSVADADEAKLPTAVQAKAACITTSSDRFVVGGVAGDYEISNPERFWRTLKDEHFQCVYQNHYFQDGLNFDRLDAMASRPAYYAELNEILTIHLNRMLYKNKDWPDADCMPQDLDTDLRYKVIHNSLTPEEGGLILSKIFPGLIRHVEPVPQTK